MARRIGSGSFGNAFTTSAKRPVDRLLQRDVARPIGVGVSGLVVAHFFSNRIAPFGDRRAMVSIAIVGWILGCLFWA